MEWLCLQSMQEVQYKFFFVPLPNYPPTHELLIKCIYCLCRHLTEAIILTGEEDFFEIAEAVFVGWFTFEYVIRFIAAPQKIR